MTRVRAAVWAGRASGSERARWQGDVELSRDGPMFTGDSLGADGVTRLGSVLGREFVLEAWAGTSRVTLEGAHAIARSAVECPPKHNVALGGSASQSDDFYYGAGKASSAINGVLSPHADFTSTLPAKRAWWQVELASAGPIDQIVLFNRVDAAARIGRFRVSVFAGPPEAGEEPVWTEDFSFAAGDLPAGGSLVIGNDELRAAADLRFVRVELLQRNILSLAEVQVWRAK